MVEDLDMVRKGTAANLIIVAIEAAAHGIEQCVGEVARVIPLVCRMLLAVVLRHDGTERVGGLSDGLLDLSGGIRLGQESEAAAYIGGVLHDIADIVPLRTLERRKR